MLEVELGRRAVTVFTDMQPGDVPAPHSDVDDLVGHVGFAPRTPVEVGVARSVAWCHESYGDGATMEASHQGPEVTR